MGQIAEFINFMTVDYNDFAQSTGIDIEICISKLLIKLGPKKPWH